ncbi:hypothetical protein [Salinibacterium sp. ZJ70]|uniref:hypothetical protein n=1 Tax=Salinibacterium sp. ZJ70 TaxID=2708084 RepID=UPI00141EF7C7|nr:hypothetical protein [Salinibacterium sp. ZJ70]
MHDDIHEDDDTVTQAPRVVTDVRALEDIHREVAEGDTIVRDVVAQADRQLSLPPVPMSLRPHHRIRVGDAELELDRPVQIGRRPSHSRVPQSVRPRLVAVASPERQISARHLELREQGAMVVATDLRTLNGSEVHLPGSGVVSLRRGESLVVMPGARIDLGEGVVVEILAPSTAGRSR